jgi:hypothetical protein
VWLLATAVALAAWLALLAAVVPRGLGGQLAVASVVGWALFWAVALVASRPAFFRRFVGFADAREIAAIRILTSVILLGSVVAEDLASTAHLPRAMLRPLGVVGLLHQLPIGFDRFLASAQALTTFRVAVGALLGLAALGWRPRLVVPLATLGYLVYAGILREYTVFYHTGLVPLYLLAVLAVLPCADAWALDRRRWRSAAVYGWARYTCWVVIALPYLASALSKLRNGGVAWADPTSIRYHFLRATLNPMRFASEATLALMPAPDLVFQALAVGSLAVELAYPLILFSRRARLVLPVAMVLFHLSVLVLQNLLFLDLILLQGVVFAAGLRAWRGDADEDGRRRRHPLLLATVTTVLLGAWLARLEFYPLSSLQMFSRVNRSGVVEYYRLVAERASGAVAPFDLGPCVFRSFAVMPPLKAVFTPAHRERTRELLATCAARHNAAAAPDDEVTRLEIQRWRWDFRAEPTSATRGTLTERYWQRVDR